VNDDQAIEDEARVVKVDLPLAQDFIAFAWIPAKFPNPGENC
jgi:hypothetical protein